MSAYTEELRPNTAFVGKGTLVRPDDEVDVLELTLVDTGGKWIAAKKMLRLADVTRIQCGGAYEEALGIAVGAVQSRRKRIT